jgi:hypothetical protein
MWSSSLSFAKHSSSILLMRFVSTSNAAQQQGHCQASCGSERIDDNLLVASARRQIQNHQVKMIDLLQDQIAQGYCNSMLLNMFWQQSQDPMLIYIYGGILLMRRGIATIDSLPQDQREAQLASLQRQDRIFAAALPEDQLAAASATRSYIEANYCGNWH